MQRNHKFYFQVDCIYFFMENDAVHLGDFYVTLVYRYETSSETNAQTGPRVRRDHVPVTHDHTVIYQRQKRPQTTQT